jgi:putative CocE/NonD family hydrolase
MNRIRCMALLCLFLTNYCKGQQVGSQKINAKDSTTIARQDRESRYNIQNVLIKTKDGASIAAIVVRLKGVTTPQPVVLQYTIYADSTAWKAILEPAVHGYTGVMAYSRGKGLSPDKIVPYEHDGRDANAVIDWISKQSWCNGKIGMYGGSYNGFTQWAAAKYHHPALKTIVPYVAAIPGLGLPMENNVFINANYGWGFYVTNNKYLDDQVYYDPQRWRNMNEKWYESGKAYRKIDSIDGTPNPMLQRRLQHPSFDKYWQDQTPYQSDFAQINIPVLSVTGYYDDGQISAMHYRQEHLKYNPRANHYLIIGPYDHFGAQRGGIPVLRDYKVDPVALIKTRDITFQWLDYILKGAAKPAMLQDKVNFEVMGANKWEHVPSIEKMANTTLNLYLSNKKAGEYYELSTEKPTISGAITQEVDLADRKISNNNNYYPYPIIKKELDHSTGLFFMSKPFDQPVEINGMFGGALKAMINKKDMDIGVALFEVMPNGEYFDLSYFLGRASYARDMSVRKLLHPGKIESIPFYRTRMVSRQLGKGSRLLVILDINKNSFAQVNYGTGKDVSDENISDANEALKIKWYNNSFIKVPVKQ